MKYLISFLFLVLLINSTLLSQDDYYWVGGTGNWSDINHWQLENGTTPFSLPNELTTVIFDENSFVEEGDYVDIDNLNVYCNDMIWENIPFDVWFTGNNEYSSIFIYGSLKFHENVINEFHGKFRFDAIVSGVIDKTIELNGVFFNNEIFFIGIMAEWDLMDDLFMSDTALTLNKGNIYLEHGSLNTNGHDIRCTSFLSNFSNIRKLNIQNSLISLYIDNESAWLMDAENLELQAENSTIFLEGELASVFTKNGDILELGNIYLKGEGDSLINSNNQVTYQSVHFENDYILAKSSFSADSVIINGDYCSLDGEIEVTNLIVNSSYFVIPEGLYIKRLISYGQINLEGSNYIEYGRFSGEINFFGDNTFDTLILLPSNDFIGSNFYFQSGSTQTIIDSLRIRGNQCSNITLSGMNPTELAYLRKDYGEFDVSCDFLNIHNVGAQSETLNFYAGVNTTVFPNPDDPPPGWILENASNYYFGFFGITEEPCLGDTIVLDATNFNGTEETLYYWNMSTIPGDITYEVTEPGNVHITVQYALDCYLVDIVLIEFDSCENNINDNLYNSLIKLFPNPSNGILNIETKDIVDEFEFTLCNAMGMELFHKKIKPADPTTIKTFDFSFLEMGVYFARIKLNEKIIVKKVIIR